VSSESRILNFFGIWKMSFLIFIMIWFFNWLIKYQKRQSPNFFFLILGFLISLFAIHLSTDVKAQNSSKNYIIEWVSVDSSAQQILEKTKIPHLFQDSLSLQNKLLQFLENQQNKGFLMASFDSILIQKISEDTIQKTITEEVKIYFFGGKKYAKIQLQKGNISPSLLKEINISERQFRQKMMFSEIRILQHQILAFCENHGYPFASIFLDSIRLKENQISARLHLDSAHLVIFDSAIVYGDFKLKTKFLENYLRISRNTVFSQQKINDLKNRFENLPYLKLKQPIHTIFKNGKAYPIIHLEKNPINEFNGVIGFLPNTAPTDQKLRVIGNLHLKLHNAFGRGLLFQMALQIPKPRSRQLDAVLEYPNLMRTNLDIRMEINLFSEDTIFSNWQQKYSLRYDAGNQQKIGLFFLRQTASPTDSIFSVNETVATIVKTNYAAYGISYEMTQIDRLFTPQKGFSIHSEIMAGNKSSTLEFLDITTNSIPQNSVQWIFKADFQKFIKTGKQSTFLFRSRVGLILNENLFVNELFRLGGFQTLRGFNENAFFAKRYWVGTAEYRLYFGQQSSLFAFWDNAIFDYSIEKQTFKDSPYGFGIGFMVGTKSGIFNFAYALGKSQTQQIRVEQSKIHFGYVSRF